MTKKKDGRANNGGFRNGAGRKKKRFEIPADPELAEMKLKHEKLLLAEALPLAYETLKKALTADTPTPLVKYVFDRVYGRPREADRLTGADEALRRELAIAEAKKRVELLEEQIQMTRLSRKDKERKEGSTGSGRDEGRFYPSGGSGVGPCGRYHASLDRDVYPASPFVRPEIFERILTGPSCPVCGDARFSPDPELTSFTDPTRASSSNPDELPGFDDDDQVDDDEDEEEGEDDL